MYQNIIQMLSCLVGHDYLYFDTAIEIKQTPHTESFRAWAVCVSPKGEVYVMDEEEAWHQVVENEKSKLLISSLHQRLRYLVQKSQTKLQEGVA